jgi:hypothetical protein
MKNSITWNKGIKYTNEQKNNLNLSGLELGRNFFKGTKGVLKANSGSFKKGHTMNKGEKSHWWKGGTTPINKLLRRSLEFKLWRESVFKRDSYTCQECGIKGGNGHRVELHPHHIKPFALFPELRFAIDNGVTLCKNCHVLTDSWGRNITQKNSIIALNN